MSTRSVLISYLERNKVFTIPASNKMPDVSYLEKEFRKEFKFQGNVSIAITLQRYDEMWEEYIDVDESCKLQNKEKLKAVVIPALSDSFTTPAASSTKSDVSC